MQRFMRALERFSELCHAFGTLVILPIMIVVITLNVLMRYFANMPFVWGEELNGLLLFLLLVLSLTYTWDQGKHIRMEILYVNFPPRLRRLADVIAGVTGIVFFGFLMVQCLRDMPYMIRTRETSEELEVPLWPFRALLVLICAIFVIRLLHFVLAGRTAGQATGAIEREGVVIETKVR